jgi:2,5-diamino-6-(ribosylamino)-4(3H)-pyrimidinone 5'-phosphate reductase
MKPYVICHMLASVDGRIVTTDWQLSPDGRKEYERTAATYQADAWMCGRITMAAYARGTAPAPQPLSSVIPKTDFIAPHANAPYAIALDPNGKLYWQSNAIDGDHVIALLTEQVSSNYLAFLQAQHVSYLFAGSQSLDLPTVLDKLASMFQIKTLLLEGGGKLNWTMLRAGLIDELSLLLAPIADGSHGTPTLFDVLHPMAAPPAAVRLTLRAVEQRADDIVWLRYYLRDAKS